MDPLDVLLDDDVKMVVAVGVYGNLPDIAKLKTFCKKNGLALIFDHAPAFGATDQGSFPCRHDIHEIYSFHATKVFSTMEGGVVLTGDEQVAECCRRLRDFGQYEKQRGDVDVVGLNAKMQEISAIVGLANLTKIETLFEMRAEIIDQYRRFFEPLREQGVLETMRVREGVFCPYLYFPVILPQEATGFVDALQSEGIGVRRYYTAVHELRYYKDKYRSFNLESTNRIKDRIVAFPLHTVMSREEMGDLFRVAHQHVKTRRGE